MKSEGLIVKKLLSLIMVFVVCLSLCACGNSTTDNNADTVIKKQKTIEVVGKWTATNETSRVYICLNEVYTGEM